MLQNLQMHGIFTLNGDNDILDDDNNNKENKIRQSYKYQFFIVYICSILILSDLGFNGIRKCYNFLFMKE